MLCLYYKFEVDRRTYLQGNGNNELGTVAALEKVSERMLNLLGYTTCLNKLQELWLNVVGTANLFKDGFSFFQATPLDETVGGVHHQESTYSQQNCWDTGQP